MKLMMICHSLRIKEVYKIKQSHHKHKFIPSISLFFLIAFLLLLSYLTFKEKLPVFVLGIYAALNLMTFIMYALDKSAAKKGKWRTPENTLHLLSLMGGWPAAMIAQSILRHKTSKKTFQIEFWLTIFAHISFIIWIYTY